MTQVYTPVFPRESPAGRRAATAAGVGMIAAACAVAWAVGGAGPARAAAVAALAAAGALVWAARDREDVCGPLGLFGVVVAADLGWAVLFFGLRSPLLGLLALVVLGAAGVAAVGAFARVCRPAAVLLVPYLLWVADAAAGNAGVLLLTRCPVG